MKLGCYNDFHVPIRLNFYGFKKVNYLQIYWSISSSETCPIKVFLSQQTLLSVLLLFSLVWSYRSQKPSSPFSDLHGHAWHEEDLSVPLHKHTDNIPYIERNGKEIFKIKFLAKLSKPKLHFVTKKNQSYIYINFKI